MNAGGIPTDQAHSPTQASGRNRLGGAFPKEDDVAEESAPGTVDMKVTTKKSVGFYIKSAKSFLTGLEDKEGNKKEPVRVLNISGLGEAINVAVSAATAVADAKLGEIKKIETSYPEMSGSNRGCARIFIQIDNLAEVATKAHI